MARSSSSRINIMFNTLAYAKKLEKAGVPNAQAEAQAEILAEAIDNNLVNKQDMLDIQQNIVILQKDVVELKKDVAELKNTTQHLEVSLRHDMEQMGLRLEGKLAELKAYLTKWFFGTFLILVGLMLSGVKLLH